MKNLITYGGFLLVAAMAVLISATYTYQDQDNPWVVPDNFASMENPIEADDFALEVGKELYSQHCKSCHGKEGLGDGPKAEQLDTPSGDFTDESFAKQSDGMLFYKTKTGRDDMPEFKKKIPDDEDVWSIIHYIRTFE